MPKGDASVSVTWGYERHSITLTRDDWQAVQAGQPLRLAGPGYHYDGEFCQDHWLFNTEAPGSLIVGYGDDYGVGFDGTLEEADIEED